jgi:hypothetical protein
MSILEHNSKKERSTHARLYAQKAARSIIEIQTNVSSITDVVVFLESLGYNKNLVMENGFDDLYDLANYIYDFMDAYEEKNGGNKEKFLKTFTFPIPSVARIFAEWLGMIFPLLASLVMLSLTGISLWMAWGLPVQVVTAFAVGVFLGLLLAEGPVQVFSRLFSYYYAQTNIDEIKRILKRNYAMVATILTIAISGLYGFAYFTNIPFNLVTITVIGATTILLHRTSYMIIFALRKLGHLIIAYSMAFTSLLLVYYFLPHQLMGDPISRYFTALASAFVVLSVFAIYHHIKVIAIKSTAIIGNEAPHFYKPSTIIDKTLKSKFGIQLWETLPHFLIGTFYFVMLFADRVVSWISNPILAANGTILPMGFNYVYHSGADLALVVMLPTSIVQYVLMTPVPVRINNMNLTHKVTEMKKINQFLQGRYKKLLLASVLVSLIAAGVLNLVAPQIITMSHSATSQVSLHILRLASISNVFMAIFAANSSFLLFMNKIKILAAISATSAIIVAGGGLLLAHWGIEYIAFSYMASTIVAAVASTLFAKRVVKNAGNILFARYV